jgi:transcription antitermination factor NusA-like protein
MDRGNPASQTREVTMKIFALTANGETIECFTWTRDEASGIARAFADAKAHGVVIVEAWAE